jgi:predicted permease
LDTTEKDLTMLPETLLQDLRYGARMLRRNAGFTVVAILVLALGIGLNDVAFTAYRAVFGRPLDARDPGRMANLALVLHSGATQPYFSYPDYEAYRDGLHSFSGLIAQSSEESLPLAYAGGNPGGNGPAAGSLAVRLGLLPFSAGNKEWVTTMVVSENYFSVLGVGPVRGRAFGDTSELASHPMVLISENYWQRRFAGDPALLGQTVRLNGVALTIAGITPRNFLGTGTEVPDFWFPLSLEPLLHPDRNLLRDREDRCCRLFGRLAPGASIDEAQAEMTVLAGHLSALHDPHSDWGKPANALVWPGSPLPLPIDQLSGLRYAIVLIMVAVGMVLVIACANVAGLQLARATSRQNELCLRLALGASRTRLVRQLLTECSLLGLLAGVVALPCSWILMKVLATAAAEAFPPEYGTLIFHVNPDLGIFAYVFSISLAAGILFGLTPALESSRHAISAALKGATGTSAVRSRRLREVFIATQVAVALALMIAGSMLIRSSIHALKVDRGFEVKGIVDLTLQFPDESKYTAGVKRDVVRRLRARLAALPGVTAVTSAEPPMFGCRRASVSLNGEVPTTHNARAVLCFNYVQPDYFQTLRIPLLSGRSFESHAGRSQAGQATEASVILSESAARRLWPGQDPVGRSLRLGTKGQFDSKSEPLPDGPLYRVIGVAGDTHGATLDDSDSEMVYLQLPEERLQDHAILLRTESDPRQLMRSLRPLLASIDPDLYAESYTFEDLLHQTVTFILPSFAAALASPIGLIGLILASIGVFGTVSYIVVLRRREVGIRLALGATRADIIGLMLREVARPVLAGSGAGMLLATGASRLLRGALHGLSAIDGFSFAVVSLLFLAIAMFAAYVPSRRATRVDPMLALRCE